MMILIDRRIVNNNNKLVIMITEKWAKFYMHLVCYSHSAAAQRHSFFLKEGFFSSSMMMRESLIFFLSLNGRCLFFFSAIHNDTACHLLFLQFFRQDASVACGYSCSFLQKWSADFVSCLFTFVSCLFWYGWSSLCS